MKSMRKAAAWLLTGAICALPCGALAETTKQETVYVKAGATGSVNSVIVETWLRNEDGLSEIADRSRLTDIENVKGEEEFAQSGEQLVWQAGGNDIYYRGSTAEQPPVGVQLAYRLDGRDVQPEDIVGQSGHIAIDVSYVNEAQADGKAAPMLMLTAMMLPGETFDSVTVDNGRVVSDGSTRVVVGLGLPGLAQAMKLGENELTKDIELPEGFTVEADVTDFRMGMTLTAATAFDMDDLDLDDVSGMDDLRDSLEELTDASTQLVDGSGELLDGVQTLKDASVELKDGTGTLDEKMGELADGLAELNGRNGTLVKGVSDLDKGAGDLAAGLSTLKQGVSAYTSGAATLAEGVTAYVAGAGALATGTQAYVAGAQQLTSGLAQYVAGADALATGTQAYVAGAQQLTGGIAALGESAPAYLTGVSQLTAGVDAANAAAAQMGSAEQWQAQAAAAQQLASTGSGIGAQVSAIAADVQAASEIKSCLESSIATDEKLLGVAKSLSGYIDELDDAHREAIRSLYNECVGDISTSIANQKKALETYSAYLTDADAAALSEQLAALAQQVETLAGGVGQNAKAVLTVQGTLSKLAEGVGTLNQAGTAMSAGLTQLTAGATALSANDEALLAGATQLTKAGPTLTAGAAALSANDEALLAGAAELTTAGAQLTTGAAALNENSEALNAGAASANSGAAKLKSGTAKLKSGSATLSDGIEKLSDGGSQLKAGTEELAQAGVDLKDGVSDLFDGAEELSDGMSEFDEEGVQELNRVLDEDVQGVLDDIRDAADSSRVYRNWMGLAEGMNGKVQFIIETASVD